METNIKISEFIGMQQTNIGWFDAEEVLKLTHTTDNTFDVLLFDKSYDWLMGAYRVCLSICHENMLCEWENSFAYSFLSGEISILYKDLVDFIDFCLVNGVK